MLMEAKACAVAGAAVCKRNADFSCARAALGTFSSVYDKRDLKIYQNDRFFCSPNRSPLIKARRHDECRVLPAMRSAKKRSDFRVHAIENGASVSESPENPEFLLQDMDG